MSHTVHRTPAPLVQDRDAALDLVAHEADGHALLQDVLSHASLPPRGQAVVLGARLGGSARAFAQRHPNWLVTALDPSVALLSASLDAVRPAGLSAQLTVLQSPAHEIPLPDQTVHAILGDFPLAHLEDHTALACWASAGARVLRPSGTLVVRVAVPGHSQNDRDFAPPEWAPPYRAFFAPVWRAAFPTQAVVDALTRAQFNDVTVMNAPSIPRQRARIIMARR